MSVLERSYWGGFYNQLEGNSMPIVHTTRRRPKRTAAFQNTRNVHSQPRREHEWFQCPFCGDAHELFGAGEGLGMGGEYEVPVLSKLPLHPDFGSEQACLVGKNDESSVAGPVDTLVNNVADRSAEVNHRSVGATARDRSSASDSWQRWWESTEER